MRILRLCPPEAWNCSLVDSSTGRSLLLASLVALNIGQGFNEFTKLWRLAACCVEADWEERGEVEMEVEVERRV